jgi:hypothetical protein
MGAALLALLAIASIPPEDAPRPHLVVTFPHPIEMKGRLEAFLAWAVKKEATAKSSRAKTPAMDPRPSSRLLPFDSAAGGRVINAIEAFRSGAKIPNEALSADEPAYLWFTSERDPPVLELALAKPELVDDALLRAVKGVKGAVKIADRSGLTIGDPSNPHLVAIREGQRLFVVFGPHRRAMSDPADPLAIKSAKLGSKPKKAPVIAASDPKPPDVWIHGDTSRFERVTGAVWIDGSTIRAKVSLLLDMATGLIVGDMPGGDHSRPLLPAIGDLAAAEMTAKLSYNGLAAFLPALGVPESGAKLFTGDIQAVLSPKGSLLLAMGIAPEGERDVKTAIEAAKTAKGKEPAFERAKQSVRSIGDTKVYLASIPGGDEGRLIDRIGGKKAAADEHATIWCKLDPRVFEAFTRFVAENDPNAVAALQTAGTELLGGIRRADIDVTFPPGEIAATVVVHYSQ